MIVTQWILQHNSCTTFAPKNLYVILTFNSTDCNQQILEFNGCEGIFIMGLIPRYLVYIPFAALTVGCVLLTCMWYQSKHPLVESWQLMAQVSVVETFLDIANFRHQLHTGIHWFRQWYIVKSETKNITCSNARSPPWLANLSYYYPDPVMQETYCEDKLMFPSLNDR